jgi:hypothetical protein
MELLAQKTHYGRLNAKKYTNFWQTTYSACLVTCSRSIRKLDLLSLWSLPIYLGFKTCSKFFLTDLKKNKETAKKNVPQAGSNRSGPIRWLVVLLHRGARGRGAGPADQWGPAASRPST